IDKNKCDHCKTCATHCPAKCIEIGETQKIDYKKCIRCFCCSELCPRDAIEVKKGNLLFVFDIAEAVLRRLKI
ncbi:MAG: 4Fe-4S binding protein, partial [Bdellovibrio sp.]|nr:4Fe-4S binding protein [Bdellovibrio sp.]